MPTAFEAATLEVIVDLSIGGLLMSEACLQLSTSFEISAEDACAGQAVVATLGVYEGLYALAPHIEPEPERIGMYIIQDDLPSPEEMEDDEECKLFMANSHKV